MPGIDSLRAIAVIGVMIYHLNIYWLPGGFLGVTVFFVLSGYLITDLLIDEWVKNNKINLMRFWARRFRRLLPAFLLMLFLVTSWVVLTNHDTLEKLKADLLPSLLYVNNWWYIYREYSYFEAFGLPSPLTHIWSLAIEEQFYLVWPFVIVLCFTLIKKTSSRVLAILCGSIISALLMAFLYIPGTDPTRVYYGTDTRAFSLLLGAALAFVWPSQKLSKTLIRSASIVLESVAVIGLVMILMMFWKTSQYDPFLYRGGMFILSFVTVLLVAALAHPASILAKVISIKPIRWIGVRSYGIYLWHYIIIILTTPTINTEGVSITRVIFQITATLVVAGLSYRYVEAPIRAGRFKNIGSVLRRQGKFVFSPRGIALVSCIVVFVLLLGGKDALGTKISQMHMGKTIVHLPLEIPNEFAQKNEDELAIETNGEAVIQEEHENSKDEVIEKKPNPTAPEDSKKSITIIGDSIIYDAVPFFKKTYPEVVVDYRIGRQMSELPEVIKNLKGKGKIGDYVIIQIGTNGPFDKSDLISVIEGLENKEVILINCRVPRPWENTVNVTLKEIAETLPNTSLVDWYKASAGKAEFFVSDGVHLTMLGGERYANLLLEEVGK